MSKNNNVVQLNKTEEAISKIETIKNLIFGENIQAYDKEFEELKQEILLKKKLMEELIEEVRQDLKTAIDNVTTDVNIRITELENKYEDRIESLEVDGINKKDLGKILMDIGSKISKE